MKKKFIYILITVLCFFSFNIGVKATTMCVYESTDSSSDKFHYNVEIQYVKDSNGWDYIINVEQKNISTGKSIHFNSNYGFENEFVYSNGLENTCKNIKLDGKMINSRLFSIATIKYGENCPKYLNISDLDKVTPTLYFTNSVNNNDKLPCLNYKTNRNNIIVKEINNDYADGVSDGETCKVNVPFDVNEQAFECELTFKKTSSGMEIYTKSLRKNGDSEYTKERLVDGNNMIIACDRDKGKKVQGEQQYYNYTIDLSTTKIGVNDVSMQTNDRSKFEERFLTLWSEIKKNGQKCEDVVVANSGGDWWMDSSSISLMTSDVAEYCSESSDNCEADATRFVNLSDWKYTWPNWYDKIYEYNNCQELIGPRMIEIVNDVLLYIRILIPILLIGLGVADFVKAMISVEESAMKKAQNKFLKRLIIAAVIFLIPSLTNLLFNLVNGVWAHINNSACNIWN